MKYKRLLQLMTSAVALMVISLGQAGEVTVSNFDCLAIFQNSFYLHVWDPDEPCLDSGVCDENACTNTWVTLHQDESKTVSLAAESDVLNYGPWTCVYAHVSEGADVERRDVNGDVTSSVSCQQNKEFISTCECHKD